MTDNKIRRAIAEEIIRNQSAMHAVAVLKDWAEREHEKRLSLIKESCPHRKKVYSGGTPYDKGEWTCLACGSTVASPKVEK